MSGTLMPGLGAPGLRSPLLKKSELGMSDTRVDGFRKPVSLPPVGKKPEGPVVVVRRAGGVGVPLAALATLAFAPPDSTPPAMAAGSAWPVKAARQTQRTNTSPAQ